MKETEVGAILLAFGFSGVLFTSSSIFFGLLATGVYLVIYGSVIKTEVEPESPISQASKVEISPSVSFCPKCGARLDLEPVTYCPYCGEKVK